MIDNTYTVYDIDITCINYKYYVKLQRVTAVLTSTSFSLTSNIESSPSGDLYGFLRGLRRCPGGQSCHLSSLKSNFSYSFRQFLWNVRFFFSTNKNRQKGCCLKKDVLFSSFFSTWFWKPLPRWSFCLENGFCGFFASTWHCLKLANAEWKKSRIHIIGITSKLHHPSVNNSISPCQENWKWYNSRVFDQRWCRFTLCSSGCAFCFFGWTD